MSSSTPKPPKVWIVSGPSGSGKTTLCAALLKSPFWKARLLRSVSFTTRALRPGEKEGRDYRRISVDAFRTKLRQQAFLEHEKIFDSYYGTPRSVLEEAGRRNKDVLLCIDVKGARSVRRRLGARRVASIFVSPPSLRVLAQRLKSRSTEDKKDIAKRLKRVKIEVSCAKDYDYVVVNDRFQEALSQIKAILKDNIKESPVR